MIDPNATKGGFQMSWIGSPIVPDTTPDYAVKPETLTGEEAEVAEQEYQRGMADRAAASIDIPASMPPRRMAE